ncbi:MAG TPA: ATP-binding protein [archaeon]|nr:ATP-binding protein [archaeon]
MSRISLLRKVSWNPPALSVNQLIKWWMILRVILVSTTMTVVWFFSTQENVSSTGSFLPPVIAAVTIIVSFLFYHAVKKGDPSEIHYFLQYFFDISLISFINLITLPVDINFVPLYVLSIAIASILSFRSGAFFAATIASVFYLPVGLRVISLGAAFNRVFELDVFYLKDEWIWLNVVFQIFLFYIIALITSYLSLRLSRTGWELEDTRKLLRQYRLDTNEILQNISSGLVTCNSEGVFVYANAAAGQLLGLPAEELIGQRADKFFSRLCPDIAQIIASAIGSRKVVRHRMVRLSREAGKMSLTVGSSLLLEHGGKLRGVSIIFEDVTHEVKARELELRSEKLEAVAELSASLAHEIKNPLASIRSAVELIGDSANSHSEPRYRKLLDCILKESDRLTTLLKQFLQFASATFGPSESIELGSLLENVLESVKHHPDWRKEVRVRIVSDVSSMQVLGHRASLSQVFFNLLINAVQVVGPGGERTSRIVIEPRDSMPVKGAEEEFNGREYHWLRFYDDGPGIDKALQERIFEPFYTTRKGGFGLGLAVVNRIVHGLGGVIFMDDSLIERGAAFLIALPKDTGQAGEPSREKKKENLKIAQYPKQELKFK